MFAGKFHKAVVSTGLGSYLSWFPATLDVNGRVKLEEKYAQNVKELSFSFSAYSGPKLRGGFGDDFSLKLGIKFDSLSTMKDAIASANILQTCESEDTKSFVSENDLPPSVKSVVETSCLVAQQLEESSSFDEAVKTLKPTLKELKKQIKTSIKEGIKQSSGEYSGVVNNVAGFFYDYDLYAEDCSYRLFCTPHFAIKADAGVVAGDVDGVVYITEDSATFEGSSDVNALASKAWLADLEDRKIALSGFYTTMKIIENLTDEEVLGFVERVGPEIASFDKELGSFILDVEQGEVNLMP